MATVSTKPWSEITAADYKDADAYCAACLIDQNPSGQEKTKDACKLPVREPGGAINRNGLAAAAAVLAGGRGGVQASAGEKKAAASKLIGLYRQANMSPPPSLRALAGDTSGGMNDAIRQRAGYGGR